MEKVHSLEDFYRIKLNGIPDSLKKEIGHFNVFRMDDFVGPKAQQIPYNRKDYYKVSLIIGKNTYHYASRSIDITESALVFSNPMIPYTCEPQDDAQTGFFCIFLEAFFNQFGNIKEYPVFKAGDNPIYFLTPAEVQETSAIFQRMEAEIKSDYVYKYDVLRNLVFELIHKAMRLKPAAL